MTCLHQKLASTRIKTYGQGSLWFNAAQILRKMLVGWFFCFSYTPLGKCLKKANRIQLLSHKLPNKSEKYFREPVWTVQTLTQAGDLNPKLQPFHRTLQSFSLSYHPQDKFISLSYGKRIAEAPDGSYFFPVVLLTVLGTSPYT